jgi:acyl-CoA dehydrogenase
MDASLFDPWFDDTHRALRLQARRFAKESLEPNIPAWEDAGLFPRDLYGGAAAAGVLAPHFPADLGGGGGDLLHGLVAAEELMRAGSGGVAAGLGSLQIALPPVLTLGTEEQKQRLVPPVLRGEAIAALAITEPGAGSDVAGVRTRATRSADGWRLSGTKTFITSGVRADLVVVLARTGDDPHRGLTFFAVPKGTPGFSVSKALDKMGWRASDTAELHFDDAFVPENARIGAEGSGFVALMHNFAGERLLLAVQGVAIAELALDDATRYAAERRAFGKEIGRFQVIRHQLAEMSTAVQSAKALTYAVALRARTGDAAMADVARAKNLAARVAEQVCSQAVQIFGGMGYMRECRVERLYRDARILRIGGGTDEIMNELIARAIVG